MIYVDNAATTLVCPAAGVAMIDCGKEYGNPSSQHSLGRKAHRWLQQARETMAAGLGCAPEEIVFTSGGSEGDTQAIFSAAAWGAEQGKRHVISTTFEHPAVLRALEVLERQGFQVERLDVGSLGLISAQQVAEAIRPDTCLVSVMYANNEIGTIQPIGAIGAICRERGVLFHTDGVQAAGQLPIQVKEENVDYLALSAHKFHGPKGVGALYVRRGAPLNPLIQGGGQEYDRRGGTENLVGIVGMAAAFRQAMEGMEERNAAVSALRDRLIDGLTQLPGVMLNGDPVHRLPGNVNVCIPGVTGETLVALLDAEEICASSGSACSSGSLTPSHVLTAIGRSPELALSGLRLTLCGLNTAAEVDQLLVSIPKLVTLLRELHPEWNYAFQR